MTDRQEEFHVSGTPTFDLELASGRIDLVERPAGSVSVTITGPHAEDFIIGQHGDLIAVHQPRRRFNWRDHHVTVGSPIGADLSAQLASADFVSTITLGLVKIKTASGGIELGHVTQASVQSASGDVTIEAAEAGVRVTTASGDVRLGEANTVEAQTASGSISVEHAHTRTTAKTASGDIALRRFDGEYLDARTISGDIALAVPRGRAIDVDIRSVSGRVSLPSPPTTGGDTSGPDVDLRARSISGDIELVILRAEPSR